LLKFLGRYLPELADKAQAALSEGVRATVRTQRAVTVPVVTHHAESVADTPAAAAQVSAAPQALAAAPEASPPEAEVHPRPPSFCTGCPERPIFTAMKLVERELGAHHVSCDIGCHLFSILPPFNIGATTMGYGLGWAGSAAFNTKETTRRTISVMG